MPATADDVLDLVRRSNLVEAARLDAFIGQHGGETYEDPRTLANLLVREGLLTYFQAEQILLGKWRGFTIGKYSLLERIGFGGMGQVFLGQHLFMKRRVAIKVLPPIKAQEPATLRRFYREARAAGALDHPNIVRAHDIDQDGNLHFIVMEYVDGVSLIDLVKRFGPMPVARATHYVRQAALGLQHAHDAGLVHRDMKPGNVMVDREGTVKVLDLGMARFQNDTADMLTQNFEGNSILGTADYVAPEQTLDSHGVDGRADIYGLGATFYFLLAGKAMFAAEETVAQKLIAHRSKMPPPITAHRPDVPDGLAAVLERTLAKDPDHRYQTPGAVAEALEPWARTPIPPPTADELPQLSPAAMATSESANATPLPSAGRGRDSTVVRTDLLRRPILDRTAPPTDSGNQSPGGPMRPLSHSDTGGLSKTPPPLRMPPVAFPIGSPARPTAETRRMISPTEDTPTPAPPTPPLANSPFSFPPVLEAKFPLNGFEDERKPATNWLLLGLASAVLGSCFGVLLWWKFAGMMQPAAAAPPATKTASPAVKG